MSVLGSLLEKGNMQLVRADQIQGVRDQCGAEQTR